MASSDDSPSGAECVMASGPGSILAGRFRLGPRIGGGPAGELMRGEDLELARPVAVRLVPPELAGSDEVDARLELRRARNARLPRAEVPLLSDLVDLLDVGRDPQGRLFLVTDPFPAESLADVLAREGPIPWQRLRDLVVRACQIVHLSHEHGMIRQDLATSSLYPVRDKTDPGTLKVVSPGLMVATGGRVWSCGEPGAALALARHAAPEQISTGVVDRRTDVYALGLILYECLTGRVPFADPRPAHVLAAHLITPPPPFPAAVRRQVPAELEAIVARALAKSPDDRWPTVMALANAMAAIEFGRCDLSGVLDSDDTDDLTEHLEPPRSATSMRIDAARLSGRAGLVPAADSSASHAWRDILDAAESASGLRPTPAGSSAELARSSASGSAITRISTVDDSAPTLAYGPASESAARWPAPARDARPTPAPRRLTPWLLAAGLSVVTAGVVSVALRPYRRAVVDVVGPASPDERAAAAVDPPPDPASRRAAPPVPAAIPADAPAPACAPPSPGALAADAPAAPGPEAEPEPCGVDDHAPPPALAGPAAADPPPSPPDPASSLEAPSVPDREPEVAAPLPGAARPAPEPPWPPRTAPGVRLPDRSRHELPDPAAPASAGP